MCSSKKPANPIQSITDCPSLLFSTVQLVGRAYFNFKHAARLTRYWFNGPNLTIATTWRDIHIIIYMHTVQLLPYIARYTRIVCCERVRDRGVAIAVQQQMEGGPPLDMGNLLNYCNQLPAQGPRERCKSGRPQPTRTGRGRGGPGGLRWRQHMGREVNWVVAARKRGDRQALQTIRSHQACCYRASLLAVDPQD